MDRRENPQAALELLILKTLAAGPVLHPVWAAIEASLLDAAARERLGDGLVVAAADAVLLSAPAAFVLAATLN